MPILGQCAICSRPAVKKLAPFCSSRCATLDLGRWLGESYRIPLKCEEPEDDFSIPTRHENEEGGS